MLIVGLMKKTLLNKNLFSRTIQCKKEIEVELDLSNYVTNSN